MKAAIIYSGKYGSTRQYAEWMREETGIPIYSDLQQPPDLADLDFLVLGSSIVVGTPTLKKWLFRHWEAIGDKPALLFTVSGTEPGHPDLISWLNTHLSPEMLAHFKYVPLRGRLEVAALPWWVRTMLRLAARMMKDPDAARRMKEGFDYMDRDSIKPILEWIAARRGPAQALKPEREPRPRPELAEA